MNETKKINLVNRFQCDYKNGNCRRILYKEGKKSFPCTMCGHGRMRLVEPRAYCEYCEEPVYDNVDLRPDKRSKEGYYLICANCTRDLTQGAKIFKEIINEGI